jgi:hypothetical protein
VSLSDSPISASQLARIMDRNHHAQPLMTFKSPEAGVFQIVYISSNLLKTIRQISNKTFSQNTCTSFPLEFNVVIIIINIYIVHCDIPSIFHFHVFNPHNRPVK